MGTVLWFKMFLSDKLLTVSATTGCETELMGVNIHTIINTFELFLLGYVGREETTKNSSKADVIQFISNPESENERIFTLREVSSVALKLLIRWL